MTCVCISFCLPHPCLWKWETQAMSWSEWAPGVPRWLVAWPRGHGYVAVRHPSGSMTGQTGRCERAGRSFGRTPSEMRPRSRGRRWRRTRSRTRSPLLRPASWLPLPSSSLPIWPWCHVERNPEHQGSPGGRRCVLWSAELLCDPLLGESLSAALYYHSAWKTIRIKISSISRSIPLRESGLSPIPI